LEVVVDQVVVHHSTARVNSANSPMGFSISFLETQSF
jgi:hypothetical protein